MAFWDTE